MNNEIYSYIASKIKSKVAEQIKENKDTDLIRYDVYQQFKQFGYETVKNLVESELKKYPSYKGIIPNVHGQTYTKQTKEKPQIVKTEKCKVCKDTIYFVAAKETRSNGTIMRYNKELDHNCDGGESYAISMMEKGIAESEKMHEIPYYDRWESGYY